MGVMWALLVIVCGLVLKLHGRRMEEKQDESKNERTLIRNDLNAKHAENVREFAAIKQLLFEEGQQQRDFNHSIDLRVSRLEWDSGRGHRRRDDPMPGPRRDPYGRDSSGDEGQR